VSQPQPGMPPAAKELFEPLWQDVVNLHVKWEQYRELYGTDAARVALLNRTAGGFFGVVERVLYDDVLLSVSRLADPEGSGQRCNLSFERLAKAAAADRPPVGATLRNTLAALRGLLAPYEDWRNKRIAHNDLRVAQATYAGGAGLSGPSRATVEDILAEVRRFMNGAATGYGEPPTRYEEPGAMLGAGATLVRRLQDLARRVDAERAALLGPLPGQG
jgi:hypothetical protein